MKLKEIIRSIIELIFPIICTFIFYKFIDDLVILSIMSNDDDKLTLLVSMYSIFTGFIITTMAIFTTSNSKALINISKEKKTGLLVFYFALTLGTSILVLVISIFKIELKVFKFILAMSLGALIQYIYVIVSIMYVTLISMHDIEEEDKKNNKERIDALKAINQKLEMIYRKEV